MNMERQMQLGLPSSAIKAAKLVNETLASNALSSSKTEWELIMEEKGATDYQFSHEYGSRLVQFNRSKNNK